VRDLFAEYLAGSGDLMPFFAAPPRTVFDRPPIAAPWEPSLVEALRAYQTEIGSTAQLTGNEAVIVTGQQPGIFTGPLYTIYKAATAIRLAARLQETQGVPCVPVFWVASDDHDFEEARTAHFLTKTHASLSLTYRPEGYLDGMPMSRVLVESSLHGLVDHAAATTPGSELRDEIAAFLHESLDRANSLSDWMARCMARLFRGTPLVIFTPDLPVARKLAAPIVLKEIESPLVSTRLINDEGRRLSDLDFNQQLVREPSDCNFFLEVAQQRWKVTYSDGVFQVPKARKTYTREELQHLLDERPDRFSPNVALRCIAQQHLFPAAAYVAGPGEIAYWAQLKPLFEHFHLRMPSVFPRARAVLASTKNRKVLHRLGLAHDALDQTFDALLSEALARQTKGPVFDKFKEWEKTLGSLEESIMQTVASSEPRATLAAEAFRTHVEEAFRRLQKDFMWADGEKLESTKSQLTRLVNTFMPSRKPQERVYTVFSFLFEHGWDLIPRIIRDIDIESFAINELEL
jgi:bacillithiol biosynthesis cysteine-adding enzyme BshC